MDLNDIILAITSIRYYCTTIDGQEMWHQMSEEQKKKEVAFIDEILVRIIDVTFVLMEPTKFEPTFDDFTKIIQLKKKEAWRYEDDQ